MAAKKAPAKKAPAKRTPPTKAGQAKRGLSPWNPTGGRLGFGSRNMRNSNAKGFNPDATPTRQGKRAR
jgi:hypothetical protein